MSIPSLDVRGSVRLTGPVSPIQVSLNIFFSQYHLNLVIARIASVLSLNDPVMEFPKRLVIFGELLPKYGNDSRML